ncbi:MAG: flavin reductase family protein [Candidatus Cloacimonetes bacterium]|nr:flavin reductase family protein [Candidatus Cloacimonadota bacterium]
MIKQLDISEVYSKVHLPAKVVMAVTRKPDGQFNLITLEWFMRTSIQPPMFAISVGHTRYSHDCLEDYRYFNLVFPSIQQKELLSLCGTNSGRDIDKFTAGGVEFLPGKLAKLPVLKEAAACLECEVVTQVKSGDHTIYVGQVYYSWRNDDKQLYYYPQK